MENGPGGPPEQSLRKDLLGNKTRNPMAHDLTLTTALLTGNWRLSEPTTSQINRKCVDLGCSAPATTHTSRTHTHTHTVITAAPRIRSQRRQIVVQGIFKPTKNRLPNLARLPSLPSRRHHRDRRDHPYRHRSRWHPIEIVLGTIHFRSTRTILMLSSSPCLRHVCCYTSYRNRNV